MTWRRIIWAQVRYFFSWLWGWIRGIGRAVKQMRPGVVLKAVASPMFALTVADYVDIVFRYEDAPVADSPGKWYANMPILARGFPPGPDWATTCPEVVIPPALGGRLWRVRVIGAQIADVEADLEMLMDVDGNLVNRRGKRIKGNLPGPTRTQIYETGLIEADLATYQSYIESVI